jgi:hypothetical protein
VAPDVTISAGVQSAGVQHAVIGAGGAAAEAIGLHEDNLLPVPGESQGDEQTGDAATDDDRVDGCLLVLLEDDRVVDQQCVGRGGEQECQRLFR